MDKQASPALLRNTKGWNSNRERTNHLSLKKTKPAWLIKRAELLNEGLERQNKQEGESFSVAEVVYSVDNVRRGKKLQVFKRRRKCIRHLASPSLPFPSSLGLSWTLARQVGKGSLAHFHPWLVHCCSYKEIVQGFSPPLLLALQGQSACGPWGATHSPWLITITNSCYYC